MRDPYYVQAYHGSKRKPQRRDGYSVNLDGTPEEIAVFLEADCGSLDTALNLANRYRDECNAMHRKGKLRYDQSRMFPYVADRRRTTD